LKTTLASLRAEPGSALFQIADDLFESEPEFIFTAAREKKLPTMFNEEAWAIRGALAAYGPSYVEMGRQGARLVDKIIKGEKPASLPIERASKFDLTLNYRTANFIGFISPGNVEKGGQSHPLASHGTARRYDSQYPDLLRTLARGHRQSSRQNGRDFVPCRSDDFFSRRSG